MENESNAENVNRCTLQRENINLLANNEMVICLDKNCFYQKIPKADLFSTL